MLVPPSPARGNRFPSRTSPPVSNRDRDGLPRQQPPELVALQRLPLLEHDRGAKQDVLLPRQDRANPRVGALHDLADFLVDRPRGLLAVLALAAPRPRQRISPQEPGAVPV